MPTRRTYGDRCGIARALDVVGDRWALLVVRELLLGPKRFTDLREGLPSLGPGRKRSPALRGGLPSGGPDVPPQRLRDLKHAGRVRGAKLPPPAASQVY